MYYGGYPGYGNYQQPATFQQPQQVVKNNKFRTFTFVVQLVNRITNIQKHFGQKWVVFRKDRIIFLITGWWLLAVLSFILHRNMIWKHPCRLLAVAYALLYSYISGMRSDVAVVDVDKVGPNPRQQFAFRRPLYNAWCLEVGFWPIL